MPENIVRENVRALMETNGIRPFLDYLVLDMIKGVRKSIYVYNIYIYISNRRGSN